MAARTLNWPVYQDFLNVTPDPCFISTEDLYGLMDSDVGYCLDDEQQTNPWVSPWASFISESYRSNGTYISDSDESHISDESYLPWIRSVPTCLDDAPEKLCFMDPRTQLLVTNPFSQAKEAPKPYHPFDDHDYWKKPTDDDECDKGIQGESKVIEIIESNNKKPQKEDEPEVEVWEIDSFCKNESTKVPRRTSARTRIIKERAQARKFTNAMQAVLKNTNARRIRQCKNIKPKNSVETTPSQSDIEEFYSQPVRHTTIKITKKKTSKGRIDHSESERHRREVLRNNFASLSAVVPDEFLHGEKTKSQVSKQKILNGAKLYISQLNLFKGSYKQVFRLNDLLKEKMRKKLKRKMQKMF